MSEDYYKTFKCQIDKNIFIVLSLTNDEKSFE